MEKLLLAIVSIFFATSAYAQNADLVTKEVNARNTVPIEKKLEAIKEIEKQNDYMANSYDKTKLKAYIDNDQKLKARVAKREGKQEPVKINVNINNPEAVKRYLNLDAPDDKLDAIPLDE